MNKLLWKFDSSELKKDDFIAFLVEQQALRFGEFTLKSGMKSPFFINLGDLYTGEALQVVGRALAQKLSQTLSGTTALFGPAYKGISLVTAMAMALLNETGLSLPVFYNRKEKKKHGEGGVFVGYQPRAEDRIVIVDDVMTTGGTKLEIIDLLRQQFGLKVEGVLVVVDRRTQKQRQVSFPVPISSVIDLTDIVTYLRERGDSTHEILETFYQEA